MYLSEVKKREETGLNIKQLIGSCQNGEKSSFRGHDLSSIVIIGLVYLFLPLIMFCVYNIKNGFKLFLCFRKGLSLPFDFAVGVHFDRMSRCNGRATFDINYERDLLDFIISLVKQQVDIYKSNLQYFFLREDFRKTINANWEWLDGESLI